MDMSAFPSLSPFPFPNHSLRVTPRLSHMSPCAVSVIPTRGVQKNREGHLIVLYDEEERVSCATATQFIEKGFLNVYVLSGGTSRFPH